MKTRKKKDNEMQLKKKSKSEKEFPKIHAEKEQSLMDWSDIILKQRMTSNKDDGPVAEVV